MGRNARILLGAIVAAALALRLACVLEQRGDPLFDHPVLDEGRYVDAARALADGRVAELRPYWQPPGIIFVLGAIFAVAGPNLLVARIVGALFSTGACFLVFLLGRRLFSPRVGLAAAAICAFHGVLVFESTELLPATYILFFDLVALLLLSENRAFFGGLAVGISALFSPTILPFSLAAAWRLRRPSLIALLFAGVLLPIAPVTARNYVRGHELVLISTNGGLNFFLGNNENYFETFRLRPGPRWDELAAEPPRHGILPQGAASTYFAEKGLAFWRAHPARAAALYARKLYLYFNGAEIPRDTDLYAARETSPILTTLVWPHFPDGILIPLALAGAALLFRRARLLLAFLILQAFAISLFFVSARHRLPAIAVLALFAAAGAPELWRRRRWAAPLVVALIVLLNLPTREARLSFAAERDFYRGLVTHDPSYFERASVRDPNDARIWLELGNALLAQGNIDRAVEAWQRAAAVDPNDRQPRRLISRGFLNLAFLHAQNGELERARTDFVAAERADPEYFRERSPSLLEKVPQLAPIPR